MATFKARRNAPGLFGGRAKRRVLVCVVLIALGSCGHAARAPHQLQVEGRIDDPALIEASGLARARNGGDHFWLIEDGDGGPMLYAALRDGRIAARIRIDAADNVDWEDLATFVREGTGYLLIADIGDNAAIREFVTLYLLEEPELDALSVTPARRIDYRYPGGPRDAEAVAVDPATGRALVLSKRSVPAELYSIPLFGQTDEAVATARFEALATGLEQPGADDLRLAVERRSWHWQPTAMDLSGDGRELVVLTYAAIYGFRRASAGWADTLGRAVSRLSIGPIAEAESIAIVDDDLWVTVEASRAPLFRVSRRVVLP